MAKLIFRVLKVVLIKIPLFSAKKLKIYRNIVHITTEKLEIYSAAYKVINNGALMLIVYKCLDFKLLI